jgi:sec-independent protein translocase protein TatB
MFDLDASKLLVVGAVALVVVGPKDLPRVLRTVGRVVGRMRRMAADLQDQFADAIKEVDLDGVKRELGAINDQANIDIAVNPATAMRGHLTTTVEGAKKSAASSANSPVPAEPTYASPEMKEYLALSSKPPVDETAASPGDEDAVHEEIASEKVA